jgi:hypothetical protein
MFLDCWSYLYRSRLRSSRFVCRGNLSWLHWLRSWLFSRYFLNSERFRRLSFRHRLFWSRRFDRGLFRGDFRRRCFFKSLFSGCSRFFDRYWFL